MKKIIIFLALIISSVYLINFISAISVNLNSGDILDNTTWGKISSVTDKISVSGGDMKINGKIYISGKLCDNNGRCLGDKPKIIHIDSSPWIAMALKEDGTVYSWGPNQEGQGGLDFSGDIIKPTKVEMGEIKIKQISVAHTHSGLLSENGDVYMVGGDTYNETGLGSNTYTFKKLNSLSNIKQLETGHIHTLALSENGRVYAWGQGYTATPTIIPELSNIVKISTYRGASLALDNIGELYSWTQGGTPEKVDITEVKDFTVGTNNYFVIKNNGDLYAWGNNSQGQLGDGTKVNKATPTRITGISDLEKISSGGVITMAIKTDGTTYIWGHNLYGTFGFGDKKEYIEPEHLTMLSDIKEVTCGRYSSVVLTEEGRLLSWGYNAKGELGLGNVSVPIGTPQLIPEF